MVEPEQERRLTELLIDQPAAHLVLADHVWLCRRATDTQRAETLRGSAKPRRTRRSRACSSTLARARTPWLFRRPFSHGSGKQIRRAARSRPLDHEERGRLTDAFSLLVGSGGSEWLEVIDARRAEIEANETGTILWDVVPDDFRTAIDELTGEQRDQAVPTLARWLEIPCTDRARVL